MRRVDPVRTAAIAPLMAADFFAYIEIDVSSKPEQCGASARYRPISAIHISGQCGAIRMKLDGYSFVRRVLA